MWLINSCRYLIMLLFSVHLSFQYDEQPSNDKSMMKKYNLILQETLTDFLETQMQVLLNDTITDLIQNKLPNIIEDRFSKIIREKLNENFTENTTVCIEKAVIGCSAAQLAHGFFHLPGSEQCLKAFSDDYRTWPEAKDKCESEGLALAKIEDGDALILRKYLVDNGVDYFTWVDGRSDGVAMRSGRSQEVLAQDNALWWPGYGSLVDSGRCLVLLTYKRHMQRYPDCPYRTGGCSGRLWFTLCEVISEIATCDVTTCEGNKECWDNDGQQQAECRCNTGYTSLQNQCKVLGCSAAQLAQGFFQLPRSEQCLKAFVDEARTWSEAKDKCESEGLALAKIEDDDALILRKYLVDNGVELETWVGGSGDGSGAMIWVRSGEVMPYAVWWPGYTSRIDSDTCLVLMTYKPAVQQHPGRPYGALGCSSRQYPLCQVISE